MYNFCSFAHVIANLEGNLMRNIWRSIWKWWIKFIEIFGTVQMVIVLTVMFWILVVPLGLVVRWFEDPLGKRKPTETNWRYRNKPSSGPGFFRDQG